MSNAYQVLEEHLRAGRLDPAEAMARHLLESNPDDANAHVAWARIAAQRGNVDEGIKRLGTCIEACMTGACMTATGKGA